MSHLDYYIRHNISPVRYDLSSLAAHFQRREGLYRTLGLLPLTVRGANVLEVAAGSGQNSLYLASLMPSRLTLVEPNPAAIKTIKECYSSLSLPHTKPEVVERRLEDYTPRQKVDIVICENWLGTRTAERILLKKLGTFLAKDGVLVITCVVPAGFLPNIVRRALAAKLVGKLENFDDQTRALVAAFAPHLATIRGMTRTAVDWVQDNMLNPAYFDLCLTVPMLIEALGKDFQASSVSPDFKMDWRWFKTLHGKDFEFNRVLLDSYFQNYLSFLDYRQVYPNQRVARGVAIDSAALSLVGAVREFERRELACRGGTHKRAARNRVVAGINKILRLLDGLETAAKGGLREAVGLLQQQALSSRDIAQARRLGKWFGRETIYVALERRDGGTTVKWK